MEDKGLELSNWRPGLWSSLWPNYCLPNKVNYALFNIMTLFVIHNQEFFRISYFG